MPRKDRERIRQAVLAWRDGLGGALQPHLGAPLDWAEATEAPCFTGRPGWDGFGSLVLWAAYAEHPGLRRPATLPEEWDNDPALVRSNADGFRSRYSHLVRNVELWLPAPSTSPSKVRMSTAGASSSARRPRSAASSTSSMRRPGRWMRREFAALAEDRPSGTHARICARYAFAVMTGLVRQAVEHRLPMKLDY